MEKIIFVYNADSGILNGIKDLIHKNVSPQTYDCRLCAITYNNFGMVNGWRKFVTNLGLPVEFLHRDELHQQYGIQNISLPAVLAQQENKSPEIWIDSITLNQCNTLEDLEKVVLNKKLEGI